MTTIRAWLDRYERPWMRGCFTVIAILMPWVLADLFSERAWLTIGWWIISLFVIWFIWKPGKATHN